MKVSIIIPVYNLQDCIEATLLSCLNQTYKELEIVIVNDGSTDETETIIHKYLNDQRIVYIPQANSGVSAARNAGIQACTGEYLTFLDGDDLLKEDTIEKNMSIVFQSSMPVDWISFPLLREDEQGRPLDTEGTSLLNSIHYSQVACYSAQQVFSMYENNAFPPIVCAMLFRKSFFDRPFVPGRYEDTYMFLELLAKKPSVYVSPYGGYRYINRSDSFINVKFTPEKWIYLTRAMIKRCTTGIALFPEKEAQYNRQLSRIYYNLKYLQFKNRADKEYAKPLEYFHSQIPCVGFELTAWVKMLVKCAVSIVRK